MAEIVNKVKQSKLETIDLEKYAGEAVIHELDLKDFLFKELLLKEKEFRASLKDHNWAQYEDVYLTVHCSTDAIIPKWAYMLVTQHATGVAKDIYFGSKKDALSELLKSKLDVTDWSKYADRFVLLKGCSKMDVPADVYMYASKKLLPHVRKLMYGEACSNVPVYNRPRKRS